MDVLAAATGGLVSDRADDARLLERIAERDTEALRELYDRYGTIVFGLALRVLGDRGLAEDCTQEVFTAVWRAAGRYDPGRGGVSTWLFALTRNNAIDLVRWHRRRRAEALPDSWTGDEAPDASDVAAAAEHGGRVAAALAELPRPQLEALVLAYFGQLTHAEIAERLRALSAEYALELEEGS
jgi:RNA polymerase sigma factor (sigma-70 family)